MQWSSEKNHEGKNKYRLRLGTRDIKGIVNLGQELEGGIKETVNLGQELEVLKGQ